MGVERRTQFRLRATPTTPSQHFPLMRVPVKVPASLPLRSSRQPLFPSPLLCPCLRFSMALPSPTPATAHLRDSAVTLLFRAASPPPRQAGRAARLCARPPPPPRGRARGGGGAERPWGAGRRAARHGRRGARALAVSPGRARGDAHSRARARTAGRRQRLTELVASLSRTRGRPQQQPRATASGAGAGTAAGGGGGAEGESGRARARRVQAWPGGRVRGARVRLSVTRRSAGTPRPRGLPAPPPPKPSLPALGLESTTCADAPPSGIRPGLAGAPPHPSPSPASSLWRASPPTLPPRRRSLLTPLAP